MVNLSGHADAAKHSEVTVGAPWDKSPQSRVDSIVHEMFTLACSVLLIVRC